jgi:predicted RNA-binding Zn-ribbon protein involved in translation (DUF1610 family)
MSYHECPHCGAELRYDDTYFRGLGSAREKLGDIYRCPNHEGFPDEESARAYEPDAAEWEEVVCESAVHHVSGSFYTDKAGNLHEGYPC